MCISIFARAPVEPRWKTASALVGMIAFGFVGLEWEWLSEKENARFRNRSFLYELRESEGEYTTDPRFVQHKKYYSW